jgi:hypothetical protein
LAMSLPNPFPLPVINQTLAIAISSMQIQSLL